MIGRIKLTFIILFLFLCINKIKSVCIPGDNCPFNSGVCKMDVCECLSGYQTLITKDYINPVYCNYKQTSRWIPFIFELFIPPIGLFCLGRYFHAFIKLAFLLPLIQA